VTKSFEDISSLYLWKAVMAKENVSEIEEKERRIK
jgi:hypothetical protein